MGEMIALLSAAGFAASHVMIKKGTTRSSTDNGAYFSLIMTALLSGIFFVLLSLRNGWPAITGRGIFWFIIAGILTSYVGRTFLYSSIQHMGAVRATAVKRLNPFFAVVVGVLILHEKVTVPLVIGMFLIAAGFWIVIRQSYLLSIQSNQSLVKDSGKKAGLLQSLANLGYLYGPISALAYAFGYVFRKEGLTEIHDPLLGACLGGTTGLVIFSILALFNDRYRQAVKSSLTRLQPWLLMAGIAISVGQILYFFALNLIGVSRVALIASTEVILTMFLSAWVFKTRENITKVVIFGSLTTMIGAAVIAYG